MGYYGIRIVGGCNFGLDWIQMNMTTCYQKPSEVVVCIGRICFLRNWSMRASGSFLLEQVMVWESFTYSSDFRQRDRKLPEFRIPLDGLLRNPDCWGLQLRTRLNSDEYDDVLSESIGGRCMHWSHTFFAKFTYGFMDPSCWIRWISENRFHIHLISYNETERFLNFVFP